MIKNHYIRKIAIFLFCFLVAGSIVIFYKKYFIVFPKEQSSSFQYTLSRAISYVLKNDKVSKKIVFSNKDSLYQSYMFFLFYSKYDPFLYQKQGGTISGGFDEVHKFGKYEFRPIIYGRESTGELLIGNINELDNSALKLKSFQNLAGKEEIVIVKT